MKISLKETARAIVGEVAPDEIELFEQMWAEHAENPALLTAAPDARDRHLGVGGVLWDSRLMTLVIIPVVTAVAKDAAGKGITAIIDYVKRRLNSTAAQTSAKLSEDEINRIAKSVAEKFQTRG